MSAGCCGAETQAVGYVVQHEWSGAFGRFSPEYEHGFEWQEDGVENATVVETLADLLWRWQRFIIEYHRSGIAITICRVVDVTRIVTETQREYEAL